LNHLLLLRHHQHHLLDHFHLDYLEVDLLEEYFLHRLLDYYLYLHRQIHLHLRLELK
jgi:hypothetical protein